MEIPAAPARPMLGGVEPSLADDKARLVALSSSFADELVSRLVPWLVEGGRAAADAAGRELDADEIGLLEARAAVTVGADLEPRVRAVLAADVDEAAGSPLAVIRDGLGRFTGVLRDLGLEPAARDDFSRQHFPDDDYGLAPASFAEVHESLHDPGLVWGAARAHVHLRRRREAQQ